MHTQTQPIIKSVWEKLLARAALRVPIRMSICFRHIFSDLKGVWWVDSQESNGVIDKNWWHATDSDDDGFACLSGNRYKIIDLFAV